MITFLCGKSLRTVGVQTQILRNDSERSDTEGVVYRQTEPVLGYYNQGMATTLCLEWLDEFHFQQIWCFVYKIQLLWSLDSDVRLSSQLFPCKIAFSKEWPPLFLFISFQLNRIFIYYTLLLMYSVSYFQRYKFNLTDSIICNYILPFIYSVYLFLFTHFSSCSLISQIFLP